MLCFLFEPVSPWSILLLHVPPTAFKESDNAFLLFVYAARDPDRCFTTLMLHVNNQIGEMSQVTDFNPSDTGNDGNVVGLCELSQLIADSLTH